MARPKLSHAIVQDFSNAVSLPSRTCHFLSSMSTQPCMLSFVDFCQQLLLMRQALRTPCSSSLQLLPSCSRATLSAYSQCNSEAIQSCCKCKQGEARHSRWRSAIRVLVPDARPERHTPVHHSAAREQRLAWFWHSMQRHGILLGW